MPELLPSPFVQIARSEYIYGYQVAPDVIWVSYAADWDQQSGTSVDGRFLKVVGDATGHGTVVLQDTFITGSSGSSGYAGRDFTITSGTPVTDFWTVPEYKKHGIFFQSGDPANAFDFIDTQVRTSVKLNHNLIILRRGVDTTAVQTTNIEIANGDTSNYRIVFHSQKGVWLDYYDKDKAAWQINVGKGDDIGNLNNYMRQNNDEIRVKVIPDTSRNIMILEIGEGKFVRHSPPRPKNGTATATGVLPTKERYRIYGTAGWCQFALLPIQYTSPLVVNKSGKQIPPEVNINNAQLLVNGSGRDHPEVTHTLSNVAVDETGAGSYTLTSSSSDPTIPPTASEVTFYIPAEWSYLPVGTPAPISIAPLQSIIETEVFDEYARLRSQSSICMMDNHDDSLSGGYGDFAVDYIGSNGNTSAQRLRGMMAGGAKFNGEAGLRNAEYHFYDNSYKLRVPILQEVNFDGWCIYDAVHYVLSLGQISPAFRTNIPSFKPGRIKASDNCPYPTLPQGTGNNPKMNFLPDALAINVLMELVQDGFPDQYTGAVVPYITGTDEYAQWNFQGYDPTKLPVSAYYSDVDPGMNRIMQISVMNDVTNIRTSLDFQGQDPFTGELLYLHYPLLDNHYILGQNFGWFERQSRWASQNYLNTIARASAILASIPTQTVTIRVPYDPTIHAGQVIGIQESDTLAGSGYFVIMHLQANVIVDVQCQCDMILTARNIATLTPQ